MKHSHSISSAQLVPFDILAAFEVQIIEANLNRANLFIFYVIVVNDANFKSSILEVNETYVVLHCLGENWIGSVE